jgi:transmembrane sensor
MARYLLLFLSALSIVAIWVIFFWARPGSISIPAGVVPPASVVDNDGILTYSSGKTARARITLPDGTTLLLNPNSTVRYHAAMGDSGRVAEVDGDVFMETGASNTAPLSVFSRFLTVTVAHTSAFRMSAGDKDEGESVAVLKGQLIAVKGYASKDRESDTLHQGDLVMINRTIDLMEKENFDTHALEIWRDGNLVFNNTPFSEVINRLQDWYGVTINVNGDPENAFNLSANFKNASLDAVLEALGERFHFRYLIEKYRIELNFS